MKQQHPSEETLALYSGGEIDLFDRLRTAVHLRSCQECRQAVALHNILRTALPKLELPQEISEGVSNWDRLSEEMTANIRLGLSAAECVTPVKPESKRTDWIPSSWVPAAAGLFLCVLSVGAFWLNAPPEQQTSLVRAFDLITGRVPRGERGVVLEATQGGLEMKQDGQSLIKVRSHPEERKLASMSASLEGSVRAGYVDDETGQVTFTNVYSGQ